jgi:hypothetical protein
MLGGYKDMARGWESKSVESQIESAHQGQVSSRKKTVTPEKAAAIRKQNSLKLARTRLVQQMTSSQNPRHLEMLEKALADLDKLLAAAKTAN